MELCRRGGWVKVGGRDSLGIFVWGTFSMINRRVGQAVNARGADAETVGNGTVAPAVLLGNKMLGAGEQLTARPGVDETAVESS